MVLFKKMVRDMWKSRAQFVAILLMSILGVMIFSGLDSLHVGLKQDSDALYSSTNMADIWVNSSADTRDTLAQVKNISGVASATARMSVPIHVGDQTLTLFAEDENTLSKPYLVHGQRFDPTANGIWLDVSFASANHNDVGQMLNLNGHSLLIQGIILSGEMSYVPSPNGAAPDHTSFGYAYVSPATMKSLVGAIQFNQTLVKLDAGQNTFSIQKNIQTIMGTHYLTSVDRAHFSSTMEVSDKIKQFQKFAYVFPLIFFSLALLNMLTTMTRLIESQRIQIGTLMSMGYSKMQIFLHYLSYGLWMGLIGGSIGMVVGRKFIPGILKPVLSKIFVLQRWSAPITLGSILSVMAIVLFCLLAVYFACASKLDDMPAVILRGSSQKAGWHTVLEKFSFWNRLPIMTKFSLRGISRNKIRSFMGVVGVLGCMMLLLAGLGMHDTLNENMHHMYSGRYTASIVLKNSAVTPADLGISAPTQRIQTGAVELTAHGDVGYDVHFTVLDAGDLAQGTDNNGHKIVPAKTGIDLSQKLASLLGVKMGDSINMRLFGSNSVLVTVTKIIDTTTPQEVLFSRNAWEALGETFATTSILVDEQADATAGLVGHAGVDHIVYKSDQISSMQTVFQSANMVVYILVGAAILLGATILYNLGALGLSELSREYATLKVLGYYPAEIRMIAFRETLLLTLLGYGMGIPCGILFLHSYMGILSSALVTFYPHISTFSFLLASVITLLCSLGVNLLLSRKIKQIDMVTSLKSVE